MTTASTPNALRGVIIHDTRFNSSTIDRSLSVVTENGPEPDQPVADAVGWMQLEAIGTSSQDSEHTVTTSKEGTATGLTVGGRYRWKDEKDAADEEKGWLSYSKVTGFRHLIFYTAPGATTYNGNQGYRFPHAVKTPDHTAVCVYDDQENDEIRSIIKAPDLDNWTSPVVVFAKSSAWAAHPSIVRVPGGRLLCFYMLESLVEGAITYRTIGMSFSDDVGATWTEGARHINGYKEDITTTTPAMGTLRVVYHDRFLTAIVSTVAAYSSKHLVSKDLGASFVQVGASGEVGFARSWDMVALPGGGVLVVSLDYAVSQLPRRWVKRAPFQPFADDPEAGEDIGIDLADGAANGGSLAMTVGDDSKIYIQYQIDSQASRQRIIILDSDTLALVTNDDELYYSGEDIGAGHDEPMDLGADGGTGLADRCLFQHCGQLFVLCNHMGQGLTKYSLEEIRIGGYTTHDWKNQAYGFKTSTTPIRVGMLYFPIESPVTLTGWNVATSGVPPVVAFGAGGMSLTAAAAGTWKMERVGGANAEPIIGTIAVKVLGTASDVNDDAALYLVQADNVVQFRCSLRFTKNTARLYDWVAAASVGAQITGLSSDHHLYQVHIQDGYVRVLYKDSVHDLEWREGPSAALQDGGAGLTNNRVEYGQRQNASGGWSGSSQMLWMGSCVDDMATDPGIATTTWKNPDDLVGRPYAITDQWLDGGVRIASVGSAAYRGDGWKIPTRYESGLNHLDPIASPSPDVPWQSVGSGIQAEIVWTPEDGEGTRITSSSIGIYIPYPNFRTAYLDIWTGAAYTQIAEIDACAGFVGLTAAVVGTWIRAAAAPPHSGDRFVRAGELIDGYVRFDPSGGAGGPWVRKIVDNTAGVWTSDANARRLEIVVTGDMSVVPAVSSCEIIQPRVAVVAHNITQSTQRYRLRIPAAITAESKFSAGLCLLGPFVPFGREYGWGRSIDITTNVQITEGRSGTRRATQRGRNRRAVDVTWPFWWQEDLGSAIPDYMRAKNDGTYEGIATVADASVVEGIIMRSRGATIPVVYLPAVPNAEIATVHNMTDIDLSIYGRIVSDTARTTIIGDENSDEAVHIATFRIEEEL